MVAIANEWIFGMTTHTQAPGVRTILSDALELIQMLTDSGDYPKYSPRASHATTGRWRVWFEARLDEAYAECGQGFINDLISRGIKTPVLISYHRRWVIKCAGWQDDYILINGHHRLAVAIRHNLKVPGVIEDNTTGSLYSMTYDYKLIQSYR